MTGNITATSEAAFSEILRHVAQGLPLNASQSEKAFGLIMDGVAGDVRIAGFLMALRARGETADELLGAVRAVRARMKTVPDAPEGTIDVCGTGGDGHGTLNISTSVAFVLAALGVPVAKHGNRALSSRAGASDVLEALGVALRDDAAELGASLHEDRLAFLAAPLHHPAMRHAGPARRELGVRTLFNLIGPMCNPANVTRQMIGVSDPAFPNIIVSVLQQLGSEKVWAVCGEVPENTAASNFIDEVTLAGATRVTALENNEVIHFELTPEMAGLNRAPVAAIAGGGAAENAIALEALLRGSTGPYRDTVLFNAACALHIAGRGSVLVNGKPDAHALRDLVAMAASAIDTGAALTALQTARGRAIPHTMQAPSETVPGPSDRTVTKCSTIRETRDA